MGNRNQTRAASLAAVSLRKSFDGQPAVKDVSFSAGYGDMVGLIGANGGGKTTCLRMLAGLILPDGGKIAWFDGTSQQHTSWRQNIGYMPQKLSLYGDLTVLENLEFYAAAYAIADAKQCIADVLSKFDLSGYAHKRVSRLSGGWAQVAQLGVTLLHQPKALLLDEPTAGLDASMRTRFWHIIRRYADAGNTVVVSTHDLDEAQQCDQILFFSAGDVLLAGVPDQIIQESKIEKLFIKNNIIEDLTNKLTEVDDQIIIRRHLNGHKMLVRSAIIQNTISLLEQLGMDTEQWSPTLADVCAMKLMEQGQ